MSSQGSHIANAEPSSDGSNDESDKSTSSLLAEKSESRTTSHSQKTSMLPIQDKFKIPANKGKFGGSIDAIFGATKKKLNVETPRRSRSISDIPKPSDLEKEFRKMLQEQSRLRKELSAKEDVIVKSDGRIQSLLKDKSHLQSCVASLEKQIKEIKRGNDILKVKINTLEGCMVKKSDSVKHELANVKCKLVAKEHELHDLQAELASLKKTLLEKEKLIAQLTKNVKAESVSTCETITSLESRIKDLTSRIQCFETDKNMLDSDKTRLDSELAEAKENIAALNGIKTELEVENCNLNEDVARSKALQEEILEKNQAIASQLETVSSQLQQVEVNALLKEKVSDAIISHISEDKVSSDECYMQLKAYKETLEERIKQLKLTVEQKDEEAQIKLQEYTLQMKIMNKNIEEKEEQLSKTLCALASLENRFKAEHEKMEESNATTVALKSQLEELKGEMSIMNNNLAVMTSRYQDLEKLIEEERDKSKRSEATLRSELELAKKSLTEVEAENKTRNALIAEQWNQIAEKEKTLDDLRNKVYELEQSVQRYKSDISKCNAEKEATNQAMKKVSEERDTLAKENDIVKEKLHEQETVILNLKNMHNKFIQERETEVDRLQKEILNLLAKVRIQSEQNTQLLDKKETLEREKGKLETVVADVHSEVAQLKCELTENAKKLETAQCALNESQKGFSELNGTIQDLMDVNKTNEANLQVCREQMQELQALVREKETEWKDTQEEKVRLLDKISSLEESVATLNNELQSIVKECQEEATLRKNAESKLEVQTQKCQEMEDFYVHQTSTIATLGEKITSLTEENAVLKSALDEKASAYKQTEVRVLALCSEVEQKEKETTLLKGKLDAMSRKLEEESSVRLELETKITAKEKMITEFEEYISSIRSKSFELSNEVGSITQELCNMLNYCKKLEEKVAELQQENASWIQVKNQLEDALEKLENAYSALNAGMEEQKQNESKLLVKCADSQAEIKKLEDKLVEIMSQFEYMQENDEKLVQYYKEMEAYLITHIEEVKAALNTQKQCFLGQLEGTHLQLNSMKQELQSFKEEKEQSLRSLKERFTVEMEKAEKDLKHFQGLKSKDDEEQQQKVQELTDECAKWKTLYLDLQAKVEPFQEQLDAYQIEKNALLGQSTEVQKELEKLSSQYAQLLGHQNHKQKIHHMNKLKTDISQLRQEVFKLREENLKQMNIIYKLKGANRSGTSTLRRPHAGLQNTDKENVPPS